MRFVTSPLIILGLLLCLNSAHAQKPPMKWGKVDKEHLSMRAYEPDTAAEAVVLCDYGSITFNFSSGAPAFDFEHHYRLKVLHESAFERGDIAIYLYGEDEIAGLKAQTITPDGKEHQLRKKDFFEEEVREGVTAIKFSMPQLQEGSIIEYTYSIKSERYFTLKPWRFQRDIPTLWSEIRLQIPEWYDYLFLTTGRPADINEQETVSGNIRLPGTRQVRSGMGRRTEQSNILETRRINFNNYRIAMENVPALKEEAFITTMSDYLAAVEFQLQMVKYEGQPQESVLDSWPELAEQLMGHDDFGKQFTKGGPRRRLMKAVEKALPAQGTEEEKAVAAYYYLQQIMNWNGEFEPMVNSDVDKCFEQKSGNSAELNLMYLAILQELGIESYPALISTRSHGKMLQLYPIFSQFNHVLVLAKLEGGFKLIDLGNEARSIGIPGQASLNRFAWMVNPENPQWLQVTPPGAITSHIYNVSLTPEGQVNLETQAKYEGYDAVHMINAMQQNDKEEILTSQLEEAYTDCTVTAVEARLPESPGDAVKGTYQARIPGGAQAFNDFIYFSPMVLPIFEENPFKLEKRSYPVDIPYPFSYNEVAFVEVPEGYTVEELPEPSRVALPNQGGTFEYLPNQSGEKVNLIFKLSINQLQFQPEEYEGLKKFLNLVLEKQGEQIVFRKKS